MKVKTTYSLDIITDTICKNDIQIDMIRNILKNTLECYQWYYQTATDHQEYVNAANNSKIAVPKTTKLLRDSGQYTLADEVEEVLYNDPSTSILTKSKVLSQAKKFMKEAILGEKSMEKEYKRRLGKYNKKYSKLLGLAFKEWCEAYPLDSAPEHFDSNWEPPMY